MHTIIWLFPIIFMFHDFEEIIYIKPWFTKNGAQIKKRFPKISERLLPYTDTLTTSSLSLGVAGMFVLICAVTIAAHFAERYTIWSGVFAVFTFHLLVHCLPCFLFRGYVPAAVTSMICLPVCCTVIVLFLRLFALTAGQLILGIAIGFVLMAGTRLLMQIVMLKFDGWLGRYLGGEK